LFVETVWLASQVRQLGGSGRFHSNFDDNSTRLTFPLNQPRFKQSPEALNQWSRNYRRSYLSVCFSCHLLVLCQYALSLKPASRLRPTNACCPARHVPYYLAGLKRYFHAKRMEGLLSARGLRILDNGCEVLLEVPEKPLHLWCIIRG
jgi:hypothetical protein